MNQRMNDLQRQMNEERNKMSNCSHTYGKAKSNPESYMEGYGSVQDGAGSDPHWSFAGYTEKFKPRWTRECTKCGHEEHTYKQKPVVSDYTPDFGD